MTAPRRDHLARTPVHTFGEALAKPAMLHHAADFEPCVSWPYCGCIRDCLAEAGEQRRANRISWVAFTFACVVPVAYGAFLFFSHHLELMR